MNPKRIVLKMLILGVSILILNCISFARINCNGAGGGYDEGGDGDTLLGKSISIETLIADGGGYFLTANSNIQIILAAVEWQDSRAVDFKALRLTAEKAFNQMNTAKEIYEKLILAASGTPYNEIVISKLMYFDYRAFGQEQDLNGIIIDEVEDYLHKGDITGVFKKVYSYLSDITDLLAGVKNEISLYRLPSLQACWRLNERISETALFGDYVARVFAALR